LHGYQQHGPRPDGVTAILTGAGEGQEEQEEEEEAMSEGWCLMTSGQHAATR
jgi:hypothetical protein